MSFLCLSTERAEEQGHAGKLRDWCGDLWKDQDVVLCFTYTPVSTVSFVFSLVERQCELRREQSV